MEEIFICKICKKVYSDVQGLNKHKMAQHPQQQSIQASNSNHINIIANQLRNNGNISITRIHKETNSSVVSQSSSAMNQNQNSFRKVTQAPALTVRRTEVNTKRAEVARVRPTFRATPDARIKHAQASLKSLAQGTGEVDDDTTTDWQKWEPAMSKDRDNVPSSTTPKGQHIISASAAEMAISAFDYAASPPSSTTARKSVPQLLRMVPPANQGSNGGGGISKRLAPGTKAAPTSQRVTPAISGGIRGNSGGSAVAEIMQNLGRMKTMAKVGRRPPPPSTKVISLPQSQAKKSSPAVASYNSPKVPPQQQKVTQPFRVNKPPQVSKNKAKIVPRNAFNNALPKPGAAAGQPAKQQAGTADDMEVDSSDPQEDTEEEADSEEPELFMTKPPVKKAVPPPPPPTKTKATTVGKASPAKSLSTNRFNPIESPKKGKGKAAILSAPAPPAKGAATNGKGKSTAAPAPLPSPPPPVAASNGTNKQSSSSSVVVAKKSVPPPASKKKKKTPEDSFKKLRSYVPAMPGTDYDMPKLSAIGSYTNRAGQQVWVCLVCNEKEHEESSRDMICCEMCEDWYHFECVGIRQAMEEDDPWYCKRCIYQASSNPKKDFPKVFKNDLIDL